MKAMEVAVAEQDRWRNIAITLRTPFLGLLGFTGRAKARIRWELRLHTRFVHHSEVSRSLFGANREGRGAWQKFEWRRKLSPLR